MRMVRDLTMMALGGCAVMAYQKYNKPLMHKMEDVYCKATDKLEDMM